MNNNKERTLVLLKPDSVRRGIAGEIISRFEKSGLKIVGLKMIWVDDELVKKHYPSDREEFLIGMGKKTLETYAKYGKDPNEELGTMDPKEIGLLVNGWNIEFMSSGPVIAVVLEGFHAIDNVRRLAGFTIPSAANPGTIRGDYSVDSNDVANGLKRSVRNIVHASGNPEEAKYEIELWFRENEIFSYNRADESVM
ncbi:MAG: nucleoside-diphosphate kinase, partial [Candidatus Pacebacteria bacterium]|nr:nucleoside-diphosphate kinase [Candidatus Paceibacterota bacterium]